jgi:F-type H+-transporting ATPase subunit alpha
VAGDLRLAYSQFEELEGFARFGTRMDEETRRTLERGRRVREILKQPEHAPLSVPEQIAVLAAANEGAFDEVPVDRMAEAESRVREGARGVLERLDEGIEAGEELSDEDRETLGASAREALAEGEG